MDISPLDTRVDEYLRVIFSRKFHEQNENMFIYNLRDYMIKEMEFVEKSIRNTIDKGEKYLDEFIKENSEYIKLKNKK